MSLKPTELGKVIPQAIEVFAAGETFAIKRFGARKLQLAAAHALLAGVLYSEVKDKQITAIDAVIKGGNSVFELLSLATGKPLEWFDDEVDMKEAAELFMAVGEANATFFVDVLLPAIPALTAQAEKIAAVVELKLAALGMALPTKAKAAGTPAP